MSMSFSRSSGRLGYSVILVSVLIAFNSVYSHGEIYSCRDDHGRALFSHQPCPATTVIGKSEAHKLWRDMRVLVNEGNSIYNKLGADVASIIACNNNVKAYGLKLDVIDKRLQSVSSSKHSPLFEAQANLRECGQCRSSAVQYCLQASQALDKEMNILLPPVVGKR